jgi:hypothetical protein
MPTINQIRNQVIYQIHHQIICQMHHQIRKNGIKIRSRVQKIGDQLWIHQYDQILRNIWNKK